MMRYIKRAAAAERVETEDRKITESVQGMLEDIRNRGEDAVREYAERFDGWLGDEKGRKLLNQEWDFDVYSQRKP